MFSYVTHKTISNIYYSIFYSNIYIELYRMDFFYRLPKESEEVHPSGVNHDQTKDSLTLSKSCGKSANTGLNCSYKKNNNIPGKKILEKEKLVLLVHR